MTPFVQNLLNIYFKLHRVLFPCWYVLHKNNPDKCLDSTIASITQIISGSLPLSRCAEFLVFICLFRSYLLLINSKLMERGSISHNAKKQSISNTSDSILNLPVVCMTNVFVGPYILLTIAVNVFAAKCQFTKKLIYFVTKPA